MAYVSAPPAMPAIVDKPVSLKTESKPITVTVEEVPLTPTSDTSETPTDSCLEEHRLYEAFASAIAPGYITTPAITSCLALTSFYETANRWQDAVSIYRRVLVKIWPDFENPEDTACNLPGLYADVCISTASKLATAYKALKQSSYARLIYLNVFRASKASFGVESPKTFMGMDMLATYYQKEGLNEELVGLYEEMLFSYKKVLGTNHRFALQVRSRLEKLNAFEMYRAWW